MGEIGLLRLRSMCDEYYDPRHCECGGSRTCFYVDHRDDVRDEAKVALNFYNQKEQKNFNLEKAAKLNVCASAYYCMLFWARNAESVVYLAGGRTVLLCEIKDDEIIIPDDHDESYAASESEVDHSPYTWYIASRNHTLTCSSIILLSLVKYLHILGLRFS